MKLNDDLYILPIIRQSEPTARPINLCLILDRQHGHMLVDTGFPGQLPQIAAALAEAGVGIADLASIIITHQDHDHIGSLHDIAAAGKVRVVAHPAEIPAIDGTLAPRFASAEVLERRPELRAVAEQYRPTPVDLALDDDMLLPAAGGVRVVWTPGHTAGHLCLYHERSRTLISGDALTADDGVLHGPKPQYSEDMAQAALSVHKLTRLNVDSIVCYHGGLVSDDALGQLRRVARELAPAA